MQFVIEILTASFRNFDETSYPRPPLIKQVRVINSLVSIITNIIVIHTGHTYRESPHWAIGGCPKHHVTSSKFSKHSFYKVTWARSQTDTGWIQTVIQNMIRNRLAQ